MYSNYLDYLDSLPNVSGEVRNRLEKARNIFDSLIDTGELPLHFEKRYFIGTEWYSLYISEFAKNTKTLYNRCCISGKAKARLKKLLKRLCNKDKQLCNKDKKDKFYGAEAEILFGSALVNTGIDEIEIIPEEKKRKTPDFKAKLNNRWIHFEVTTLSDPDAEKKVEEVRNELDHWMRDELKNIDYQLMIYLNIILNYKKVEEIKETVKNKLRKIIAKKIQTNNFGIIKGNTLIDLETGEIVEEGIFLKTIKVEKGHGEPHITGPVYEWDDIKRILRNKLSGKTKQLKNLNSPTVMVIFADSLYEDRDWDKCVERLNARICNLPFMSGIYLWLEIAYPSKKPDKSSKNYVKELKKYNDVWYIKTEIIRNPNPNTLYPLTEKEIEILGDLIN